MHSLREPHPRGPGLASSRTARPWRDRNGRTSSTKTKSALPPTDRCILELHEFVSRRVEGEVGGRLSANPAHRLRTVRLYSFDADFQDVCNALVAVALGHQLHDLPLAWCQLLMCVAGLRIAVESQQGLGHEGGEVGPMARHRGERLKQFVPGLALVQIATGR